jgi:uncharacterized membrane protein (UPF0127 family)
MIEIKYADNYIKRLLGLMFKKDIDYGLLFILKYGSSIHTCFMNFTIDVYFLDENKIIFEKVTLKPWKFYKPSKKAKYILETKKNYINLKKGEKLELNKL